VSEPVDTAQRASQKLQHAFDAIADALLLVEPGGLIEHANPAAAFLLGGSREALVGKDAAQALSFFISPEQFRTLLQHADAGRKEMETRIGERYYRVSADPVKNGGAWLEGVVLILSDVSDRKRLEEEQRARAEDLHEASRRKDEFLGMLAHELRNPLNAISVASGALGRTATDERQVRLNAVINRQVGNLARLVEDLLEVSRITRGKLQLRKHHVDFVSVVRQAVHAGESIIESRNQSLLLEGPETPIWIDGDDLRLEQVVLNLLNNASKYSEPGSRISIAVTRPEGGTFTQLSVNDAGIGLAPDMLNRVFEPFLQIDQSLSRSLGGLGIGLTMVRNLAELHGGTALAKSEGLGKGSTFYVRLPVLDREPDLREVQGTLTGMTEEVPRVTPESALKVLVVEDNLDTLELVREWIETLGHNVQTASDGRTGLSAALATRPDVALVDVGLPEVDGYEFAKSLRAADPGKDVRLVAITGYGRPEDRARALDAGFDAYVVKPVDEAVLRRILQASHGARQNGPASVPPRSR
jgi:PAS domain S-box-containing protein